MRSELMQAVLNVTVNHFFFGSLLAKLPVKEDLAIETAQTNGKTIIFNPEYVAEVGLPKTCGILVHELLHVGMGHTVRRGGRDHNQWNIACDHEINLMIADYNRDQIIKLQLPDGALFDEQFRGMKAERIYEMLEAESNNNESPQDKQQSNSGPGENTNENEPEPATGPQSDFGGTGSFEDMPPTEGNSELTQSDIDTELAEWKVAIEQAQQQADICGKSGGGGIARAIETAQASEIDWLSVLRDYMEQTQANQCDWSRPRKRYMASELYLPNQGGKELADVVFVVDTSGSINDRQLEQDVSDISTLLAEFPSLSVKVLYCDTRVYEGETYGHQDLPLELEPRGGGGTDFRPPFEWVEENMPECKLLIYWTDLCCCIFPEEPDYPVIWVNTFIKKNVPFGEVVSVRGW